MLLTFPFYLRSINDSGGREDACNKFRARRGRGGDYPMSASITSERAMANTMVVTADDGGRIAGSRMAMRVKALI